MDGRFVCVPHCGKALRQGRVGKHSTIQSSKHQLAEWVFPARLGEDFESTPREWNDMVIFGFHAAARSCVLAGDCPYPLSQIDLVPSRGTCLS